MLFRSGEVQDAYRLLDLMEALVPHELEPYAERLNIARHIRDAETIAATVGRARNRLDQATYDKLMAVADAQQNP